MNYMQELQAECEADEAQRQRQKQTAAAESVAAYREMSPLIDRLRILLDSIPPEIRQHGVSLPNLQARLRGRSGKTAHVGELGAAMRALGMQRIRLWREPATEGFRAVWKTSE